MRRALAGVAAAALVFPIAGAAATPSDQTPEAAATASTAAPNAEASIDLADAFGVSSYDIDVGFATVGQITDLLPLVGAMALRGPEVATEFASVATQHEFLGAASSYPGTMADGGRFQRFDGGVVLAWEGEATALPTSMALSYAQAGGPAGELGRPTGDLHTSDHGAWHAFSGGAIFAAGDDVMSVRPPIWTATLASDPLALGFPTGPATEYGDGVGQVFQSGLIWAAHHGEPLTLTGELAAIYTATGGFDGELGTPSSALPDEARLIAQRFTHGAIYITDAGYVPVAGEIFAAYETAGGAAGELGPPTGAAEQVAGGIAQSFAGGGIYVAAGTGPQSVTGPVFAAYAAAGGPNGEYGLPTGPVADLGDGVIAQPFVGGTIQDPPPWRPLEGYLGPVAEMPALTGGIPITLGWNGTRVNKLQNVLGIARYETNQTYDAATQSAVMNWQASHGLPVTGVVNAATWDSFNTGVPFTIDAWRPDVAVGLNATREQRIEAMIAFAESQLGAPYSWGGAGPYNMGYDCSGIVLAALNAAGIDVPGVDPLKHAEPQFRSTRELYHHPGFLHVPLSERTRGDIILWTNSRGVFIHAAIYLGDGKLIEATMYDVHYNTYSPNLYNLHVKPTVLRPFPEPVQ